MGSLAGKTLFITGASRGIGKAIGLRAARDGANVVVAAKTAEPHPKLEGTVHSAAAEMVAAGGRGLACVMDIRDPDQVQAAVQRAVDQFGGIDVLVNNASAIFLADTLATPVKRFDLMHEVNVRGTYVATQACLPHLQRAANPHVLNIAPPLNLEPRWFAPHVAYSIAKMGMSLCVLGMAEEWRERGVAFHGLWPRTAIATAAIRNLLGGEEAIRHCRKPEIMADAAHWIVTQPSRASTGRFFLDEEIVRQLPDCDLDAYAVEPGVELMPDFFV